jgi:hypothetical protein
MSRFPTASPSRTLASDREAARRKPAHRKTIARGLLGAAAVLALLGSIATPASAAPGDTSVPSSTTANVEVGSVISLVGLTSSFLLSGLPGDTTSAGGAVSFNVETNNLAGYEVTVASPTGALVGTDPANTDTIQSDALSVEDSITGGYQPVTTAGVVVETHDSRSADGGDVYNHDYRIVIPFVNADTYTGELDYLATTL